MMMTAAFNGFYSIDDTIELINKSFISLGYIENNILIGYTGLLEMYSNITCELHPMIVKYGYRNMGIGSKLLKEIEREAKSKNVLNIILVQMMKILEPICINLILIILICHIY